MFVNFLSKATCLGLLNLVGREKIMSLQDPIADLFTRIRNGQSAKKFSVECQKTNFKMAILALLKREGYISDFQDVVKDGKAFVEVMLKYSGGEPAISEIKRVSKPSLPRYSPFDELPDVYGGLGTVIVSTPKGVLSKVELIALAKKGEKFGGEIVGTVV